jgi:heme O synthase-like polyprenyltransferase
LFVHASWVVARAPSVQTARRCFFASLAQLSLLLLGIFLEALVLR